MLLDVVEVESKAAPQETTCDFFDLVLHLNGEKDSSNLMKPTMIKRYNYQELTLDGQKWSPSPTFLTGLSWLKATQLWKTLEKRVTSTEFPRKRAGTDPPPAPSIEHPTAGALEVPRVSCAPPCVPLTPAAQNVFPAPPGPPLVPSMLGALNAFPVQLDPPPGMRMFFPPRFTAAGTLVSPGRFDFPYDTELSRKRAGSEYSPAQASPVLPASPPALFSGASKASAVLLPASTLAPAPGASSVSPAPLPAPPRFTAAEPVWTQAPARIDSPSDTSSDRGQKLLTLLRQAADGRWQKDETVNVQVAGVACLQGLKQLKGGTAWVPALRQPVTQCASPSSLPSNNELSFLVFAASVSEPRRSEPVKRTNPAAGGLGHDLALYVKELERKAKKKKRGTTASPRLTLTVDPLYTPRNKPPIPPYLMSISDLMSSNTFDTTLELTQSSQPNQEPRTDDLCTVLTRSFTWNKTSQCRVEMAGFAYAWDNKPLLTVAPKITAARATTVTRNISVHGKVKAATKVVQMAATTFTSPLTHLMLPVATRIPVIQPCCVPPVEMRTTSFPKPKVVYANQLKEDDTVWWLQRARMLRISKKLRSRKRRGQANTRQVFSTRTAPRAHHPAVRPLKLLTKKKVKGWERRAVSRQRMAARRLSSARSKLGLAHKATAEKTNCDEHVCCLNSFFNCFTSPTARCIVTWKTHLILSSSLIRGIIS